MLEQPIQPIRLILCWCISIYISNLSSPVEDMYMFCSLSKDLIDDKTFIVFFGELKKGNWNSKLHLVVHVV